MGTLGVGWDITSINQPYGSIWDNMKIYEVFLPSISGDVMVNDLLITVVNG